MIERFSESFLVWLAIGLGALVFSLIAAQVAIDRSRDFVEWYRDDKLKRRLRASFRGTGDTMTIKIPLGVKVRDKITGFVGIVTGRCEYLTGCHQVLVSPPVKADGSHVDAHWYDEQRLDVIDATAVVLDNSETPGFDVPAPVR